MALKTRCKFYYGVEVLQDENFFDFDEGSGELTATIAVGIYSPQEFATKLSAALSNAGGQAYSVTFDRTARSLTISAAAPFDILISSGSHAATTLYTNIGFSGGVDLTGASSYTGPSTIGIEFVPQFYLLDYVALEHNIQSVQASINETASGDVEVLKYGRKRFMECSLDFISNVKFNDDVDSFWTSDVQGVEKVLDFLDSITQKGKAEFMPDLNDVDTYFTLLLESTETQRDGTGFKLKEMTEYGCDYFSSGKLIFREAS